MADTRIGFDSPLQPGAQGADVAQAHALLMALGSSVAEIELRDKRYGAGTSAAVTRWQQRSGLPADGLLSLEALARLWEEARKVPRSVAGTVTLADGTPVPNALVIAIDRDFRSEEELGRAATDAQGRYYIAYRVDAAMKAEKGTPDIGLRVLAADAQTVLWKPTSRNLVMNAPVETRIDVVVQAEAGAVTTEFARIRATLEPLIGDVKAADVGRDTASDEGDFLARESGFDLDRLAHFVVAHRIEAESKLPSEFFYALLREDGLFGVADGRPRAVLTPVDLASDTRAVLYEAVLLPLAAVQAALQRAVRKHLVAPGLLKRAEEFHKQLQAWRKDAQAYVDEGLPRRLLDVLDGLLSDGKARDLLTVLGPHDLADVHQLFGRLDLQGAFAPGARPTAEARLQLADLLGFNVGLVNEVSASQQADAPDKVRALARLERKDWSALIERGTVRMGGKPVAPALARQQASVIVRRFEKRFPTAAFSAQLARRKPAAIPAHEQVAAFLEAHPGFELQHHKLRPFLKEAGLDSSAVAADTLRDLERVQRVFRLTSDYRKTEGLLAAGYGSASDIVAAGRSRFVTEARRSAGLRNAEAKQMFEAAVNQHTAAVMVATQLRSPGLTATLEGDTAVALRKQIEQIVADQPDLASLFGSTGGCACSHCRSIYGPAAYFADAMRFLGNRLVRNTLVPGGSTKTALDRLAERRPDLWEIDLNCDNAEVPVPHIDIVCELLEEAVAPDAGFDFNGAVAAGEPSAALVAAIRAQGLDVRDDALIYGPYAANRFMLRDAGITVAVDGPGPNWHLRLLRQTHGSPAERAAAPEYVNSDAYALLATGKAAFGLPFDLFHTETDAFLGAAGVPRVALMRALAVAGVPSVDVIAGEALGLAPSERALIFAPSVGSQADIWSVAGPVASNAMRKLDVFCSRTGLDYDGVAALVSRPWIRSGVDFFIRHLDNSCDLSAKEIVGLTDAVLDRIHRELRLALRTGLSAREIDRLAAAARLGASNLGAAALRVLPELQRLAGVLAVDVGRLITWLDRIPTDGTPSEHALLFQNPAATGVLDPGLTPAAISANEAAETAVPNSGRRLAAVAADLAVALGVTAADLQLLLGHLGVAGLLGPNPPLTAAALAALHGRIGLARALKLTLADYLGLERLVGVDPLASVTQLATLVDAAGRLAEAGVPVPELEYRLARRATDLALWDLADVTSTQVLQGLHEALVAVAQKHVMPYDESLSAFEQLVALETLLKKEPGIDDPGIATLTDLLRTDTPTATLRDLAKATIDAQLADRLDAAAIKARIDAVFAAPGNDVPRKALIKAVMEGLSNTALREESVAAATAALAALLRADDEMAAALLHGARLMVGAVPTPLVELLTQGALATPAVVLSPAGTPDLYRALRLAYAVQGLIKPFEPAPATVAFLLAQAGALGWLPLDGTPFEGPSPAPAAATIALADWLALAQGLALIRQYPATDVPGQPDTTVSALTVLSLALGGGPGKSALLDAFALLAGWPRALLGDIDTRFGWALADYRKPSTWATTGNAVALVHQLGVPLSDAVAFCAEHLGDADRRNARRLLRTRYHPNDWLGALKALMDPIRERKRDALVSFVLAANPALTGKPDLYDHFLTDTEWSSKMPSSRLVHAHATLQLYVRRCIEGLEPKAAADLDGDTDWSHWEWMRNYRVWEVNRKVFVDAQYYLRPEWRDDKTEGFADFESALMQTEINEESTTAAYEGYLDRLDQIAFLDVLATCYDFDQQNLHVFAATKGGEPRSYFHRMLQRERVWTPWRKIELDIAGEHLIAFFRNKRLYLAWATFLEKGDDQQDATFPTPQSGGGDQPLPKSVRWTECSLAVSEYTGKKWLPRRVSVKPVRTPKAYASLNQSRIVLSVTPDPERFTVDVHMAGDSFYLGTIGSFLLTGCKGYPEARQGGNQITIFMPMFKDTAYSGQRLEEQNKDANDDQLAMSSIFSGSSYQTLFGRTFGESPATFRVTYPFQVSELDRLISIFIAGALPKFGRDYLVAVFGTLMPFFYEDNRQGYVLVPGFYGPIDPRTQQRTNIKTFSNVRQLVVDILALFTKYLQLLAAATTNTEKDQVRADFLADPEYARILEELHSYRGTGFGIVVRNFYHPLACHLRERFFQGGVPGLLARSTQLEEGPLRFEHAVTGYAPDPIILPPYPRQTLEFDRSSAYADINWELTFHAPHMIAAKLIEEGTLESLDAAERWLRYIFDPRGSSNEPAPRRYWNTKPFYQRSAADYQQQLVSAIMERIAHDPHGTVETELADAVLEWRRNPFKPYLVARSRTVAFQQAIVHLTARLFIARGDAYFRRDQLEDLVMASLDYSRAERLLGPRPTVVPPAVATPPETYSQLSARLDFFGNALCRLENLLPDLSGLPHGGAELPSPLSLESLYFCIPPSEKLYELWDQVAERQFNLRNSRTIDGVERELSLFAPPLSVEALIQAAASGLSLSSVLAGLSAPRPPYRFRVMLRHAIELAEVAVGLSQKLEQALSARDGEGLQRLKVEHEGLLLKEQTAALEQEVLAAGKSIESAQKSQKMHQETQKFFGDRPYMNEWEIAATVCYGASLALQIVTAIGYIAAGGLALIPKFMIGAAGFGGSPTANAQVGGDQISQAARDALVGALSASSGALDKAGSMLSQQGNFLVRQEDWENSARVAKREAERADIEIKLAQIRQKIATEQLRVHGVRRLQNGAENTYLRNKFTNRELYDWLSGQLRGLSRQLFNLAFGAARAAEHCFNFELGLTESFVRPGQWNDTRRGLLAADQLVADLRRMDSAYLQRHVREKELTDHLSLARLDPTALTELRMSGRCVIQVPEAVFDLYHPGHYFRRIKALSVTVPCVAGPYSAVPLKITQTSNRIRAKTDRRTDPPPASVNPDVFAYAENPDGDVRFRYNVGAIQSISLSRGQDDAGLFQMNLDDERYLPFEGSGVVGTYVLELPPTLRPFDYGSISDVVLHLRYTARDGGGGLRTLAANTVRERLNVLALKTGRTGLFQAFDLRRDRPDFWHRLTTAGDAELSLSADDLPYFTSGHAASIAGARVLTRVEGAPPSHVVTIGGVAVTLNPAPEPELTGLLASSLSGVVFTSPLTFATTQPAKLKELVLIVNYALTI